MVVRLRRAFVFAAVPAVFGLTQVGCVGDDSAGAAASVDGGKDGTVGDGAVDAPSTNDAGDGGGAAFQHVFLIMMENHGTDEIIGNTADAPYINSLLASGGLATNYYGVTHPSLPNYLAMLSGDYQGIFDDCKAGMAVTCAPEEFVPGSGDNTADAGLTDAQAATAATTPHLFTGSHLVDQLEAKSLTWKAYMQGIPSAGDTSEYAPVDMNDAGMPVPRKLYAQKHNPFMYFANIRSNAARMQLIVPFTQFATDIGSAATTPTFVWISPDQCHDMHGVSPTNANAPSVNLPSCGYPASGLDHGAIKLGDDFLKDTIQKIQASPAWQQNSAIAIVWDEDDYAGYAGCCGSPTGIGPDGGPTVLGGAKAPAIILTSKSTAARTSADPYNHYSLLATIQKLWGLPCLARSCDVGSSGLMTKLFTP